MNTSLFVCAPHDFHDSMDGLWEYLVYLCHSWAIGKIRLDKNEVEDEKWKNKPEEGLPLQRDINRYQYDEEQHILSEIELSQGWEDDISDSREHHPGYHEVIFQGFEFIVYIHNTAILLGKTWKQDWPS